MDAERFDAWTRTLGQARSRRRVLAGLGGALAGALGLRATAGSARAQEEVTVCEDGETLTVPAPAAEALLARGASPGPCPLGGSIGSDTCCIPMQGGPICYPDQPFELCAAPAIGGAGCCPYSKLVCTPTFVPAVTACQVPCATDADCRAAYPHKALACRADFAVCPFLEKCCVPA